MAEPFIFLEDEATADVAFIAYGNTLDQIFENACYALVETMIDLQSLHGDQSFEFVIQAEDINGLLYDLLESILVKFETEDIILSKFAITINTDIFSASVKSYGEIYHPEKHIFKTHIKAITFFGMEFTENSVKVTLDL